MKNLGLKSYKMGRLLLDYDIYPRHSLNDLVVNNYVEARKTGAEFPPIRVEKKTLRVADGFHRYRMYEKQGEEVIEVELYEFKDNAELLEWAIRWNSGHGSQFTTMDRARCLLLGQQFGLDTVTIATAMNISLEKLERIERDRIRPMDMPKPTKINPDATIEQKVVLKRPVADSLEAEEKVVKSVFDQQGDIGGMGAGYYLLQASKMLNLNLVKNTAENHDRVEKLISACDNWVAKHALKMVNKS